MFTIQKNTYAEIIEKKSKFIAQVFYVQTIDEVEEILRIVRRKYHDAKHHCYAYSIMTKDCVMNRMSDDGEPNGTAGAPILNIIQKKELSNILIVVTRYFGGILLGTGGLVKAYSEACMKAIEETEIVKEEFGYLIQLTISYSDLEKFNYYCNKNKINIVKLKYQDKIISMIELTKEEKEKMLEEKQDLNFKIEECSILEEKNIRKKIEI